MASKESSRSNGIGLGTLLFCIFLTLKLAGIGPVAHWSWWWVAAPLWIPLAIVLAILLVVGIGAGLIAMVAKLPSPISKNHSATSYSLARSVRPSLVVIGSSTKTMPPSSSR